MRECYRFIVSGRVQGVFFRQSTADTATRLGLDGWVRNLPDGRVEGRAAGSPEALAELRGWLDRGPPAARVDGVEWVAASEILAQGFVVRR
ncbi:acylphosphatase [Solimonas sp. SE-A11]|uniref:acylphosphatase n=1 Tax=Solimonas sp. SE-A11 TaxID=3054954 RepID=UPI00259CD285|nr:acylphosphatase [Solimonas sp. SE-A11]MDM4768568.1 acylphosphatase [Solimonas sp. SE-A11]